jgi:hypothetical protein
LRRRSVLLLAVALLLGSAAAFTWTERLKLERPPATDALFDRNFSPVCGCRRATAGLTFLLLRADRIDVAVVDDDGEVVRTLARGLARPRGRVELTWDGRDDGGRIVPDAPYRVRVHLERADRTVLLQRSVRVDTRPPRVQLRDVSATTFALGGEGIEIRYRLSEPGKVKLLVDGRRAVSVRVRDPGAGTLRWDGTLRSRTVAPGVHELALAAVDRAGNRSEPTAPVSVAVT